MSGKDDTMMTTRTTRRTLAGALAPLMLVACASPPAVPWPAALAPAAGETWVMTVAARGVQVYECRSSATGSAWAFVAPEAELFDDARRLVGSHGAGPIWRARDGSQVQGTVTARADAPVADAVPWLLLRTTDTGPTGIFSRITSVRRIHTVGGMAPQSGCGPGSAGATARVPYAADYLLYTAL